MNSVHRSTSVTLSDQENVVLEYINVVKAVVASAKDAKTRKPLFPVVGDHEYLDLPVVAKKDRRIRIAPHSTGKLLLLIAGRKAMGADAFYTVGRFRRENW